jgi:hypothetical protein
MCLISAERGKLVVKNLRLSLNNLVVVFFMLFFVVQGCRPDPPPPPPTTEAIVAATTEPTATEVPTDTVTPTAQPVAPESITASPTPLPATPMPTNTLVPTQTTEPSPTPTDANTIILAVTSTATAVFPTTSPGPLPTVTAVSPDPTNVAPVIPTISHEPAYTRFNFEVAGHVGRDGTCFMHRTTGELLLIWQMQDGWTDSATHPLADSDGWIPIDISHQNVYVNVYCDAGNGIIQMDIYNGVPHPDDNKLVGWLSRGVRNAIEIGWP